MRNNTWTVVLTILALSANAPPRVEAALRAGAAVVSITADPPQRPVHDPILAKALVLDDGSHRIVIITLDIGQATGPLFQDVRERLRQELGIDPGMVLMNASHNHNTLGQEAKDLAPRIAGAVKDAIRKMVPARIGAGAGREGRITMNRRLRLKDGKYSTIRLSHPTPKDADVTSVGPFDPEIGLLRVDNLAGRPLALVYNFAGHPYEGVPDGGVTADLPGFASKVIETAWPGAVALFVQGAGGDVTPIRYKDFDFPAPTEQLGTRLGLTTLESAQKISTAGDAAIRVVRETLSFPRRTDAPEKVKALLAEQEKIIESFNPTGPASGGTSALNFKTFLPLYLKFLIDQEHPTTASFEYMQEELTGQNDLRHLDALNKKKVEMYLRRIEAMERLITVRTSLQLERQHMKDADSGPISAEILAMKIGDFAIVTFPGELFAEIGLRIKKQSRLPHTFISAYSNGHIGYAPGAGDFDKGAYEEAATSLAPEWEEIYVRKALDLLARVGN